MIVWRETHPDQWEEQRQKKEEERRKMAEKAIRAERKRRQHQARLQRAMHVSPSPRFCCDPADLTNLRGSPANALSDSTPRPVLAMLGLSASLSLPCVASRG